MAKRTMRSTLPRNGKATDNSQAYGTTTEPVARQETGMDRSRTRADSIGSEPSEEEIRMRAYRRYLERGGADGWDFDDWLEAEKELKSPVRHV